VKESVLDLLRLAGSKGASDLHMSVGFPPMLRINGSLERLDGREEALSLDEVRHALDELATPEDREEFYRNLELDFGYTLPDVGRLRCNAAWQRGAISFAIRLLPPKIPTIDELELPQLCKDLATRPRGLLIVSGPTGSGKSTTLAAMISHINTHKTCHVVTIEDPIEYTHNNLRSVITQRELGADTHSFAQALKHVLRQDPDVILLGEMRDLETAAAVLTLAETGHLVFTTGHAPSTYQCVERFVDLFPPEQRYLAQSRLASLLVGVLCQALIPRADGSGRIAAVEIMLGTSAVANLIREGKVHQLPNVIRTSTQEGMETLDQALVRLYLKGIISGQSVLNVCQNRDEVERLISTEHGFGNGGRPLEPSYSGRAASRLL
jgi:twitching motility protein PilT